MNPAELSTVLLDHVRQEATRRGADAESITAADVTLERPRNRDHGDWASNVAMKLGKRLGTSPREFADALAASLAGVEGISGVDVAGPGFLNITLDAAAAELLLEEARTAADQAVELQQFTRRLHEQLSVAEKQRVVEMLWQVALADSRLDKHEDHLVRRIAELLYVPHSDLIRIRNRVRSTG